MNDWIKIGLVLLAVLAFLAFESWRYGECIKVGHSETYCTARLVGCVE